MKVMTALHKTPLIGMTLSQIQTIAAELGMPKFAAKQITDWLYHKGVTTIEDMTNLSKKHRELLSATYCVGLEAPVEAQRSVDGTIKYLYQVDNNQFVEAVYIPDGERATLCVSSQVGCKMGCAFCMTGRMGFIQQLTAHQILNQIAALPERDKLTNVVYMGMGEPLDNLDNVLQTLDILTASWGFGWSPKRITVSTIGIKKGLQRFIEESDCHLAVSLHAPFPMLRQELMPAEKAFSLTDIVTLLSDYDWGGQRRLSFEYIVFDGINDQMEHAKSLVRLLKGLPCRINLIRFHRIPDSTLDGVGMDKMQRFRDYLTSHGVMTTIRASRGEDIFAACGMLSTEKEKKHHT